jgi:P63C domain
MSETEVTGRAKGGVARAQLLTPEERRDSARKAAQARWTKDLPYATHEGSFWIGDVEVQCAVLNTGQRVLTQSGFMKALGRARQAKGRQYYDGDVNMPAFLTAKNLKPFISKVLEVTSSQIEFRPKMGGRKAFGYRDELLPEVCDVFIKADRAGKLTHNQKHIADQAHVIMKGLANTGIAGLIDEATGYQEVRDKYALQAILDEFLRDSLAAWAKRFPDEFYWHIFRLKGWEWKGRKVNPPQVVAYYTNDLVYHRLAPNLVEELDKRNPVVNGRRRSANTQWLTDDVGQPALNAHLRAVIGFMRVAKTWDHLKEMMDIAFPRQDETMRLPFFQNLPRLEAKSPNLSPIETLPLFSQLPDAPQA